MTATLAQAAVWYARRSHPVFPCIPGDKRPATRHGFKDATTDVDRIRRWWARHPDSNIGLPTGHAFDVIDVDMPTWELTESILDDLCPGEWVGVAATPRGGCHIYLPPTGAGNHVALLPGIDYRGKGGYVVAPPSVVNGNPYVWKDPPKW